MAKTFEIPKVLQGAAPHGCCSGCGHGIATRIIYEVIEELGMSKKAVAFHIQFPALASKCINQIGRPFIFRCECIKT